MRQLWNVYLFSISFHLLVHLSHANIIFTAGDTCPLNALKTILCTGFIIQALRNGYCKAAVVPVRPCVRPCVDLVKTIETKPLCASSSNLADIFTMTRGWTLLILEVKVTIGIYWNKLVSMIETKPLYASSSNLADMLAIVREWTLLILEVKGQGHNRHIW